MNFLKKAYCRGVQLLFKIALPLLPYKEPKILKKTSLIAGELKARGLKKPLIVTDAGVISFGLADQLIGSLAAEGLCYSVYDRTKPNPTVKNVEEAAEQFKAEQCDSLIAIGGGSSIDCAKGVGARLAYPKKTFKQLKGTLKVLRRIPFLIAVPTTAGTGSEVTLAAVITDGDAKHKYTMNNFTLIPSVAVLDPEVTYTLPPHLTATTGMDALTHAVEAYIGRSTTKRTRADALEATKLIMENILIAYEDGRNEVARANMLKAAYLAGAAFSKSYVGYVHAIAHSLGGQYNVPHGLANSVILPIMLKRYGKSVHKKLYQMACYAGVCSSSDDWAAGANKFIAKIEELLSSMNVPDRIDGIDVNDLPKMAKHASREANPLYPVPVLMDAKQLEEVYLQLIKRG